MDKKLFKLAHLIMKFAEVATDKGTLVSDSDLEIGVAVQVIDENGEPQDAADGEYKTENDIIVVEGGVVKDIKPIEQPADEQPEDMEEEPAEPATDEPATDDEKEVLKAKVAELEAAVAERDARIEELTAEVEKLKNKPVDEPIEQQMSAADKVEKKGALKYFA